MPRTGRQVFPAIVQGGARAPGFASTLAREGGSSGPGGSSQTAGPSVRGWVRSKLHGDVSAGLGGDGGAGRWLSHRPLAGEERRVRRDDLGPDGFERGPKLQLVGERAYRRVRVVDRTDARHRVHRFGRDSVLGARGLPGDLRRARRRGRRGPVSSSVVVPRVRGPGLLFHEHHIFLRPRRGTTAPLQRLVHASGVGRVLA